jgi:site-specific DNA recombinase
MNDNHPMTKYAVAYIRISTEEQSTFSITSQLEYCKKEAIARGYELPDEYIFIDEGFSAKTTKRPALLRMLELCKRKNHNIHGVIIYKIDRLARDTADYLGIRKLLGEKGVKIISCTEPTDDSPAGEFIETILAASARYDNAIKSERVSAGVLQRIKSGLSHGKASIGYLNQTMVDNRRIIIKDPEVFPLIQNAWLEMEKGIHSLQSIADLLNRQGVLTKKGARRYKLTEQQVARIFSDKTYCGYAVSKKHGLEIKSNQIPQMITEDTFFRVRSILIGRNSAPSIYQKIRPEFPLRGFLICSQCSKPLRAGFTKGRHKYYAYYFCTDHTKPSIPAQAAEDSLIELLRELTPNPLLRKMFLEDIRKKWNDKYFDFVRQEERIKEDIELLKEEKHIIGKKNREGIYSDIYTKDELERIELEIITKQSIQSESRLAQIDIEVVIAFMNAFLEDLGKVYMEEKSVELRRLFIGSIFPKKLIYDNGKVEPLELATPYQVLKAMAASGDSFSADERS